MHALFLKAHSVTACHHSMKDCIAVKLHITKNLRQMETQIGRLIKKIDHLAKEWDRTNLFIIPFNHLGESGNVASRDEWNQAYGKVQEKIQKTWQGELIALPYLSYDHAVQIEVSGDDGSVRNMRCHNINDRLHTHGGEYGIQWMILHAGWIQFKLISPAKKPFGIQPQPLRDATVESHNLLETMFDCLVLLFQVEEHCSPAEIEKLHAETLRQMALQGTKNLFISGFAHLTTKGASYPYSWQMFEQVIKRFEQTPEITVQYSNFGWEKEFSFWAKPVGSGRFASSAGAYAQAKE